jgi:hypothetical protein
MHILSDRGIHTNPIPGSPARSSPQSRTWWVGQRSGDKLIGSNVQGVEWPVGLRHSRTNVFQKPCFCRATWGKLETGGVMSGALLSLRTSEKSWEHWIASNDRAQNLKWPSRGSWSIKAGWFKSSFWLQDPHSQTASQKALDHWACLTEHLFLWDWRISFSAKRILPSNPEVVVLR